MCQNIGVDVLCVSVGTSSLVHDGVAACRDADVCAAFWAMGTDYVRTHREKFIQVDGLQILSHKQIDMPLVLYVTLINFT